ncbi:MAG: hypothetical protein AAGF95_12545 [Chloroflexota bacterium]
MTQHKATADELIDHMHEQKRRRFWRVYRAMIGIVLMVTVFGMSWFIWHGLYPCEWLDRVLQRSGCYETISLPGLTAGDAIAIAPNNHLLAVGGITVPIDSEGLVDEGPQPTSIKILDMRDKTIVSTFPISETALQVQDLSFSPDSTLIAAGIQSEPTRIWHVDDSLVVQTIDRYGSFVTFMSNNELLIDDERWQMGNTEPLETIDFETHRELFGYGFDEVVSPDGIHQAVAVPPDSENRERAVVEIRRRSDAAVVHSLEVQLPPRSSIPFVDPSPMLFSPDGRSLVTRYRVEGRWWQPSFVVLIWDVETGSLLRRIQVEGQSFRSLAWTPDGTTLAMSDSSVIDKEWIGRVNLFRIR